MGLLTVVNDIWRMMSSAAPVAAELSDSLGTTTFYQINPGVAVVVNGTTWKDLYDGTIFPTRLELCGILLTVAGVWLGAARFRIINNRTGTKIFPFQDEYTQGVEWVSGIQIAFAHEVVVHPDDRFKIQFRSTNAADGAGATLSMTTLDLIIRG